MNVTFGPTSSAPTWRWLHQQPPPNKCQGHRKRALHEVGEACHLRNLEIWTPKKCMEKTCRRQGRVLKLWHQQPKLHAPLFVREIPRNYHRFAVFWSPPQWVPIKLLNPKGWWFEHWNATLHRSFLELCRPKLSKKRVQKQKLDGGWTTQLKNNTPPKFNIAPQKWWLEDNFPVGIVNFQGRTVKVPGSSQNVFIFPQISGWKFEDIWSVTS